MLRAIQLAIGVIALIVAVGLALFNGQLESASESSEPQDFVIARGDAYGAVAERLEANGLIQNAFVWKLLGRREGLTGQLKVGEYELSPSMRAEQILEVLTLGRVKTYTVTIPEGSRATDIATRLEAAGLADAESFLQVVNNPDVAHRLNVQGEGLEGYLYPDTYRLPRSLPPLEIARTMTRQFESVWSQQIAALAKQSTLSKPEIVTLASIVEKETAAPEERPLIAAVFLNRMKKRMRLETDPTVIYGIEDFDGNLRKRDLRNASNSYNTYRIVGLPPGPIASPGAEALLAVVEPAETEYLYFVSRNDGTHHFSATYKEHVNAVNRYQRRRRSH
jgi:UPF0755 protein